MRCVRSARVWFGRCRCCTRRHGVLPIGSYVDCSCSVSRPARGRTQPTYLAARRRSREWIGNLVSSQGVSRDGTSRRRVRIVSDLCSRSLFRSRARTGPRQPLTPHTQSSALFLAQTLQPLGAEHSRVRLFGNCRARRSGRRITLIVASGPRGRKLRRIRRPGTTRTLNIAIGRRRLRA